MEVLAHDAKLMSRFRRSKSVVLPEIRVFMTNRIMTEQMGMYELFVEKKVSYQEIVSALVKSTKIPSEKIGSEYDFYEPSPSENYLSLGIKVEYYNQGYLSFINLVSMPKMSATDCNLMYSSLALNLDMNVAVYSSNKDVENILVFYPNGFYQEAIEDCSIQDGFIIQAYGDMKNCSSLKM